MESRTVDVVGIAPAEMLLTACLVEPWHRSEITAAVLSVVSQRDRLFEPPLAHALDWLYGLPLTSGILICWPLSLGLDLEQRCSAVLWLYAVDPQASPK